MLAVAVSGGVDSLACLLQLRQNSSDSLIAVHGLFHVRAEVPPGLVDTCASLSVQLHVADLRREFEKCVVTNFIAEHAAGRTPNPCAICNRQIKFGALLAAASRLGVSRLATGHYAHIFQDAARRPRLAAACDSRKDQSYFLSLVPPVALARAIFPLATLNKMEARQIVAAAGLKVPVTKESQDICFLEKQEAAQFLAGRLPSSPGPILLYANAGAPMRHIGNHDGLWRYTVGQRRGLGIPWREPLYVSRIDVQNNALVLAPRSLALMRGVLASRLNFYVESAQWPAKVFARLRYNQQPVAACCAIDGNMLHIKLAEPILATAPGQVAAIYDVDGNVLCGGIVENVLMEAAY